jgi:L-asparaginase II
MQNITSKNPIIATVSRGDIVESQHHGSYVVSDARGKIFQSAGDLTQAIYPRSAIKAFQALPLLESGAADHFNLNDEEIALCCSSHNGETDHVRVARSILQKCGASENEYECGSHWPTDRDAQNALVLAGEKPKAVHNNCSGKHAGMLALAKYLNVDQTDYVKPDHTIQKSVADVLERFCDVKIAAAPMGIDGCSLPNWAMPLPNMALGFARLANANCVAGARIIAAARNYPFMIAGSKRFDTEIMQKLPRLFIKVGAEGVFCGAIPHAGLGFALKCEDGNSRAAEVAIAGVLAKLQCWTDAEKQVLHAFTKVQLKNWRGLSVGDIKSAA